MTPGERSQDSGTAEVVGAPEHPYAPLAHAHATRARERSEAGPGSWVERFVGGYITDGPRVRMGLVWFVVAVASAAVGMVAVALVFGLVAGAAATQTASAWRRAGHRPNPVVAGVGALAIAFAATIGIGMVGLAALGVVAAAAAAAFLDPRSPDGPLVSAGLTIRSGFFVGVVAASAVLLARTDGGALVALVVLVSGYEVGDYLVGTGAGSPLEGPVAGISAVLVLTFAISVFAFPPFETGSAWVFGGLAAVLAPLGPLVASAMVPAADARVPALRRLDSWLLVTPVWAWMLWSYLL